ncbi:MAG: hypothetical protein M1818_003974 [Claussenomyces sp. TS43310]|nr:MAG: hypothetical protein M1818_003974 [Claussenomyces sp. TS43310]
MEQNHQAALTDADVFSQLDNYQWDQDKEFQAGLSAILGSAKDSSLIDDLTLRARCFYISRKKAISIDFNEYKAHVENITEYATDDTPKSEAKIVDSDLRADLAHGNEHTSHPVAESSENPKYPTTFAEIVKLITEGKEIPGIKDIPPTVLHGQATVPTKSKRRKPWEKEVTIEDGTFGDHRDDVILQEVPE